MTAGAVTAAIAVAVWAAPAATAASVGTDDACRSSAAARVVARGAEVVVTVRRPADDPIAGPPLYVACDRASGKRTRLENPADFGSPEVYLDRVQVRGRYVAYVFGEIQSCSQCPPGSAFVRSINARSGKRRNIGPTTLSGASLVSSLVSDSRGHVAWIGTYVSPEDATPRPLRGVVVRKFDAAGPGQLSSDPAIDEDTLHLDAVSRLRWTEAGEPRSRVLR